jgi:tungstate transport system substrate-binding protein
VGRIPFLDGKMPNDGLVLMVRGDPLLRRPYVVEVASAARFPSARVAAARQLAEFMRREETQQWIAEYGRGQLDDQPLFLRVQHEPAAVYGSGSRQLVVATGSPGELGLLKILSEEFSRANDVKVLWREAGSGESLRILHDKQADVAMVHAASAERKAVDEGWATRRTLVGSNEFFIVGPADDPAQVRTAKSVVEAYQRIARSRAKFLSRADGSGTHNKEMAIWQNAGIVPEGDWYIRTHDFMMATLRRANAENGYFMTDSSTWVVGRNRTPNLRLLFQGDPFLVNVYNALCQPEGATPGAALAAKLVDFLASEKGQKIIRDYGKDQYGDALYRDALYARQFE